MSIKGSGYESQDYSMTEFGVPVFGAKATSKKATSSHAVAKTILSNSSKDSDLNVKGKIALPSQKIQGRQEGVSWKAFKNFFNDLWQKIVNKTADPARLENEKSMKKIDQDFQKILSNIQKKEKPQSELIRDFRIFNNNVNALSQEIQLLYTSKNDLRNTEAQIQEIGKTIEYKQSQLNHLREKTQTLKNELGIEAIRI